MKKLAKVLSTLILFGTIGILWAGTPDNGSPSNGAPVNGVSGNGVPVNGAPANGLSGAGVPVNGSGGTSISGSGVPVNGAPGNGSSGAGVPINGASGKLKKPSKKSGSDTSPNTIGSATGGAGSGKAKFGEFQVNKKMDQATTHLSGPKPSESLPITIKEVVITPIKWQSSGKGGDSGKLKTDGNHTGSGSLSGGATTHPSGPKPSESLPITIKEVVITPIKLKPSGSGGAGKVRSSSKGEKNPGPTGKKGTRNPGPAGKNADRLLKAKGFQNANGFQKVGGLRKAGMGDGRVMPGAPK
jgi:hypothetical protein